MQAIRYWFALVLLVVMAAGVLAGFVNLAADAVQWVMGQ